MGWRYSLYTAVVVCVEMAIHLDLESCVFFSGLPKRFDALLISRFVRYIVIVVAHIGSPVGGCQTGSAQA